MAEKGDEIRGGWTASVYYADALIDCAPEEAWATLLDYQAWNPDFVGAQVTPVCGHYRTEGEKVAIKETVAGPAGTPPPEFYAETVKVIPQQRIVWCVYPKEGDEFRNFVDLGVAPELGRVRFSVRYYELTRLPDSSVQKHRRDTEAVYVSLAAAFKAYCETHRSRS